MMQTLLLLLNLLTEDHQITDLAHQALMSGVTNTGIALFLGSFLLLRRAKLRRNDLAVSRA